VDSIKPYLPFSPTVGGTLGFILTVAAAVWIARKLPVVSKLV